MMSSRSATTQKYSAVPATELAVRSNQSTSAAPYHYVQPADPLSSASSFNDAAPISVPEDDDTARLRSKGKSELELTAPPHQIKLGAVHLTCPRITFLQTWTQTITFVTYIGLYLIYGAWVHITHDVKYSPAMMIMSVLFTKLTVSLLAFLMFDGSFPELSKMILNNKKALSLYVFPAFAYATTDSLGVFCLRRLDPSTFAILYNIRVAFMLILFQRIMHVSLRCPHWVAMGLITGGCVLKELPNVFKADESIRLLRTLISTYPTVAPAGIEVKSASGAPFSLDDAESVSLLSASLFDSRLMVVLILLGMAQLAAFAAVYNEKLLKEQKLPLNVQNIAMYAWAICATVLFSILLPLKDSGGIFSAIGNPEEWRTIWSYPIVVAVALSAAYGLVTSFFIKSLNNVIREIACALHIIGTIPVNYFFFGYGVGLTDVLAVATVIAGISIYNRNPLKPGGSH